MPDDLYDRDILIWSERQAALLRQLAHGERPNEPIDWDNVIDEVESVGLSELHGCESALRQAITHLLKLYIEPNSPAAAHWRGETFLFLSDARSRFAPSMRRRLDLQKLYRTALRVVRAGGAQFDAPDSCPYTLDDLLNEQAELDELLAKLG